MIRVHTARTVHEFPAATRFNTEDEYNNLCIWSGAELLGVFADGQWTLAEFCDG